LYANGEYKGPGKRDSGRFVYSQATGALDIEKDFDNGVFDFSIYGINKRTDKHTIYSASRNSSRTAWRLTWSGEPDGPSPSQRKALEKAMEKEKNRYKFITHAGEGIQPDEIEAVVYASEIKIGVMGADLAEDAYLLMKDGRVMDAVPVAPDILDVAKSRSREPDKWGYWKKEGERYKFAWGADQKRFVLPEGSQTMARPIPNGTMLSGQWKTGRSSAVPGASFVTFWGVTFTEDGRFERFKNSSSLAEGASSGVGVGPMVGVYANDEGSVSVVSGANIGGGSRTEFNNPEADRQGRYQFNGYNLTLEYDNGDVTNHFTFTTGDNFSSIWFLGDTLGFDKDE